MQITYLAHSGFLVETKQEYLLFDYYRGTIPELNTRKHLYVFVSHKHPDHYNHVIWELIKKYPNTTYILAKDIPFSHGIRQKIGIAQELADKVVRVRGNESYTLEEGESSLVIRTLRSTDEGVAFLITTEGKKIYHAGDLNLWLWKQESKQFNENMQKRFEEQMQHLVGESIDVAFLPLDFRQEEDAGAGMDYFIEHVNAGMIIPMHLWEHYDLIEEYCRTRKGRFDVSVIRYVNHKGQTFQIG